MFDRPADAIHTSSHPGPMNSDNTKLYVSSLGPELSPHFVCPSNSKALNIEKILLWLQVNAGSDKPNLL